VCTAFIEHTLESGRLPTWDTDGMNERSRALASSLGFVEDRMFSQLSTPDYKPIQLSEGVWRSESGADGVTVWRRG
jgi:hypothetical protein